MKAVDTSDKIAIDFMKTDIFKKTKLLIITILLAMAISAFSGCHLLGEDTNILTFYTPTPTPDLSVQKQEVNIQGLPAAAERLYVDIPPNSFNALLDENIPEGTSQVILVTVTEDSEKLYCFESMQNGWKAVYGPYECNIGRAGLGKTKEGDNKSPVGVFNLGTAFGQGGAPEGSNWPWIEIDENDYWVEDSNSAYYNSYVDIETTQKDWKKAEKLMIDKYRLALEVKYNPDNKPGIGSAIFLHVWGGENALTGGCTAMAEENLNTVLTWLRPEARPVFFQTDYIRQVPEGFCYIKDFAPDVELDIRFCGSNNILGKPAHEYYSPVGIASVRMAKRLDKASLLLEAQGLSLLVYDSYRPQTTVTEIVDWINDDADNIKKGALYPNMDKSQMIDMYFEAVSPYPRGGAADVSILDANGRELDMGTCYQYIDEKSAFGYEKLTDAQLNNRELLRDVMIQSGLTPNDTFWWSFYMEDEPFPDDTYDFYVQ